MQQGDEQLPIRPPGRVQTSVEASKKSSSTQLRPRHSRSTKKRTGCEQCKRRKVKCDEKKPSCSRCQSRGDTCTGNFRVETWQIERPWVTQSNSLAPGPALENETLRYWYNTACRLMAMFPPPVNPLSYSLSRYLQRSRALRHAIESVSRAHHSNFSSDGIRSGLNERNLAIVSLQGEITRIQSAGPNRKMLIQTLVLTSLILCVSSSWLDESGQEFGSEFLLGVRKILPLMLEEEPTDSFEFYILGLYLYCECFSAYLSPISKQILADDAVYRAVMRPPFDTAIHPVTGIATTLCPILTEIGHLYRRVVDGEAYMPQQERRLRRRLFDWSPPAATCPEMPQLLLLAEGYRDVGDIMLYQAQRIRVPLDPIDAVIFMEKVISIMTTIKHLPRDGTLVNWMGPLLMIAGSELTAMFDELRDLVRRSSDDLVSVTRIPVYGRSTELIEQVWRLRDQGQQISWLELMLERGLALGLG